MAYHILQVRTNILYSKEKSTDTELKKFNELVFLVDKPSYIVSNEGNVIRQRGVEEIRMMVSEEGYKILMQQLAIYQSAKEEDLE